jgi:hypothetical protein
MTLPYRTRRFFRGLAIFFLILVLAAVAVWLVWLLWLDRYVVYTSDGAKLDFSQSDKTISGVPALPPEEDFTVSIYYNEGDNVLTTTTELTQVSGYFISTKMLELEMDTVMSQVRKLPANTPVLVEVKDITGRFYFSTSLGPVYSGVDTGKVEDLLTYLKLSDLYPIALFPALRDYFYGLDHVSDGIFLKSGKGLWMDDDRCYWLNPSSKGTQEYILRTIEELKAKGFAEVVLGDFAIPDTDKIKFSESRKTALSEAAVSIAAATATDRFCVSFCVSDTSFYLPEGRTRMYMKNAEASSLKTVAAETGLEDPQVRLVFITDANDTRFDEFGVLRPLNAAQLEE